MRWDCNTSPVPDRRLLEIGGVHAASGPHHNSPAQNGCERLQFTAAKGNVQLKEEGVGEGATVREQCRRTS